MPNSRGKRRVCACPRFNERITRCPAECARTPIDVGIIREREKARGNRTIIFFFFFRFVRFGGRHIDLCKLAYLELRREREREQ